MTAEHGRPPTVDANRREGGRHLKSHGCGRQAGGKAKRRRFKDSEPPGKILGKQRLRDRSKEPAKLVRKQPRKTEADPGTSHRRRPHTDSHPEAISSW